MLFFFNLYGSINERDIKGVALQSLEHARLEAVRYLGVLMREQPGSIAQGEGLRVEVTNADRVVLFTVLVFGTAPANVDLTSIPGR